MAEYGMGPGQLFQQERIWEKRVAEKILQHLKAQRSLRKDRDDQLDGLYSKIPPPPELPEAKTFLRYRMAVCRSGELRMVIAYVLKFVIKPLLDLFSKDPALIPSYWQEAAGTGAKGVIMAPGRMIPEPMQYEDELIRQLGEPEMEDELAKTDRTLGGGIYDRLKQSFIGSTDSEEGDLSEEEDLDM